MDNSSNMEVSTTPVIMSVTQSQSPAITQSLTMTSNSIVVSVPLTATSILNTMQSVVTSAPALHQQMQPNMVSNVNSDSKLSSLPNEKFLGDEMVSKRAR